MLACSNPETSNNKCIFPAQSNPDLLFPAKTELSIELDNESGVSPDWVSPLNQSYAGFPAGNREKSWGRGPALERKAPSVPRNHRRRASEPPSQAARPLDHPRAAMFVFDWFYNVLGYLGTCAWPLVEGEWR